MNREMEVIKSAAEIPIKNTNLFNKHLFPPSEETKGKLHLTKWYVTYCRCQYSVVDIQYAQVSSECRYGMWVFSNHV